MIINSNRLYLKFMFIVNNVMRRHICLANVLGG